MQVELLAALLLLAGVGLYVLGLRGRSMIPRGRVIYIDSRRLGKTPETLHDPATGLTGRPDFLLRQWRGTVPVELKSSKAPRQPHHGHILQIAAYCHLVEATTGRRPSYGVIRYRDRSFRVAYSRRLRHALRQALDEIRAARSMVPGRSHHHPGRCHACSYRSHCDQKLG